MSTSLISRANITLADVAIQTFSSSSLRILEKDLKTVLTTSRLLPSSYSEIIFIDPKAALKGSMQRLGGKDSTLIDEEEVKVLAIEAYKCYERILALRPYWEGQLDSH